jgi:hypothetical protein
LINIRRTKEKSNANDCFSCKILAILFEIKYTKKKRHLLRDAAGNNSTVKTG